MKSNNTSEDIQETSGDIQETSGGVKASLSIELSERQKNIISDCHNDAYNTIVVKTGRQVGKVQPLSTRIHTPYGLKLLSDLKIGDEICGNDNNGTVLDIFPHTNHQFYKIKFCDGTETFAGLEHLWQVVDTRGNEKVVSTEEMLSKGLFHTKANGTKGMRWRMYVPIVKYASQELPIDPYLLGLLLGGGCITKGINITSNDEFIHDWCKDRYDVYKQESKDRNCFAIRFTGDSFQILRNQLKSLDLFGCKSHDKFIPELYLTCSYEQRLELLKGLMDTDGSYKTGQKTYFSKSHMLAQGVQRLAKSLGMYCNIKDKNVLYNGENSQTTTTNRKYQRVISIEKDKVSDGACISVSTIGETYVCDDINLTHNTTLAQIVGFQWAMGRNDIKIGFALPTYKQCKNIFNRYKTMLKQMEDLGLVSFLAAPEFSITFTNGSVIQFFTADNDNFRGFTFDFLIADEACFIKNEIYHVLLPTVAVSLSKPIATRGKVLLLSTPKTKNWFYDMTKSESPTIKVHAFTSEEGGIISKEVLEEIKRMTPDFIFANEYLGEFLDSGAGLFKFIPCIKNVEDTRGTVAGLDIGSKQDSTVLTIMNKTGNVIHISKFKHQEYEIILQSVKIQLEKFGSPKVFIESNGVGQMPYEYLKKIYGNRTNEWITSSNSKRDIIHQLILDFNTRDITIPDDETLKEELDNFTCEWVNGKPRFEGSNGTHDDHVMSLAICNFNKTKVSIAPRPTTIRYNQQSSL